MLNQAREHVKWFLDHARAKISYDDFMMVITIFVLFGDDVRILSFPPSADATFSVLSNISFFLFIIELILNAWAKSDFSKVSFSKGGMCKGKVKGYMFSFFFWLDFLAILSMIPDLKWFGGTIIPSNLGSKTGRAGKIGAKTARVVRMARLVRLVKLYKITSQRLKESKMQKDLKRIFDSGNFELEDIEEYIDKFNNQKQSKVGAELSDIITRRVIVAVLLMLCVVPLLSYSPITDDALEATDFLHNVNIFSGENCDALVGATNKYKEFMMTVNGESDDFYHQYLVSLDITPDRCDSALDFKNNTILTALRPESIKYVTSPTQIYEGVEHSVSATFNIQPFLEEESLATIYLTMFVIFMLVSLSAQFTGDAQKLVLEPIESMMEMVNMVADDPLEEYDFEDISGNSQYETRVVQIAIQKITALLRVGFGVAGAEIISSNMATEGEGAKGFEPMIPGRRVYAIFGFCDIHEFDHCTEKLEDEIMTFVNSVARIVHEEVTRWGGRCNKNLGNAFLMVWRIGDQADLQAFTQRRRNKVGGTSRNSFLKMDINGANEGSDTRTVAIDLRRIPGLDLTSDKALIGFLKVIVEINRDEQIKSYHVDPRLEQNGNAFDTRMGFGLHAGWAIEGAVGSLQKVDATYLSPHVNMAARMEAASRQFGVAILMTERFHELMSPEAQDVCRKIDIVTVKGSAVPMPIYTYDTLQNQKFPTLKTPKYSCLDLADVLIQQAEDYEPTAWVEDPDLVQLRRLSTPEFNDIFKQGVQNYLTGNWTRAKESLEKADGMMTRGDVGGDGPSRTILNYMKNRQWECPSDWKGYRPLTSK